MTVSGINGTNLQALGMGQGQGTDAYSRNIQNQIANAQRQLKELASNQDLPQEEKMKKKQEIQQEIAGLNQQLRQHQMEVRREAAQKKESAKEEAQKASRQAQEQSGRGGEGMSSAGMQALISADAAVKQAKVQGGVKAHMEGRAGVLKAEIKQDGGNTEAKEAQLAEVENKAANAGRAQAGTLAEVNKDLRESAKKDEAENGGRDAKGPDSMAQSAEDVNQVPSEQNQRTKAVSGKDGFQENGRGEEKSREKEESAAVAETGLPIRYTPVDVRI